MRSTPQSPEGIPLGAFTLAHRLASGGMGEVWLARHRASGLPAAVKVLRLSNMPGTEDAMASFRQEVRAVAALDHPGIVVLLDQGDIPASAAEASRGVLTAGSPYLVMEYAGGGDLGPLRGRLGWPALRRLLLQLLGALAHAHAREVIHRDIKPSNVVIATSSDLRPGPKLTDFGIAHLQPASDRWNTEDTDPVVGSPSYMAPEQIEGHWRDYGPWTDLYSFGCLAWALAAEEPPFSGLRTAALAMAHLTREPPAFEPSRPVPPGFEEWLRHLLAKEPGDRFPFAADAAEALKGLGEPTPVRQVPRTWRGGAQRTDQSRLPGGGLGLWGLRAIPLVGRTGLRDSIWEALAEAGRDRRPRLVLLEGPPGTGKSRLARWVAERAGELGAARHARGKHDPIGGLGHGLVPMLQRLTRSPSLRHQELADHVATWLGRHGGRSDTEARALVRLFRPRDGEATADPALFGQRGEGAQRHALVARTLARAAGDRPLVLVLEDVQWGPDTLAFLEFVHSAAAPRDLPLLVVATTREEELGGSPALSRRLADLATLPGARRHHVGPLAPAEHQALVRSLVGLEETLVDEVARRTQGSPLFAVLLVDDWIRRGALEPSPDGLRLRSDLGERLPGDVLQLGSALLVDALGDLPPRSLAGLELVAALGGGVEEVELAMACHQAGADHPDELLERLASRKLAVREDGAWSLPHSMLAEVLRDEARSAGRWEELNRACADALTELYSSPSGRIHARIGRHLLEAEELDSALDHLLAGARERVLLDDYAEAAALLDEAEATLVPPGSSGESVRDRRWGETLALRALLHVRQDEYEAAQEAADRAEAFARRFRWPRVAAEAFAVQGHAARRCGDYARAADLLAHAQLRYTELGDARGITDCRQGQSMVALRQGRYDAGRDLANLVLDFAEETVDGALRVAALATLAELDRLTGRGREARARLQEAIRAAHEVGSLWYVGFLFNTLGELERLDGEPVAAVGHYADAEAAFVQAGSKQAIVPRFNNAYVELALENYAEAGRRLSACLVEVASLGWKTIEASLHIALMACAAGLHDWEAFARHHDLGGPVVRLSGSADPDVAIHARRAGKLALATGRIEQARQSWELARDVHLQLGDDAAAEQFAGLLESLG